MTILKQTFLIIIGSLLTTVNYAQCPIGETEITIQFIEDGLYPDEVSWDYKIQGVLSESGPYTIDDIITTCVPLGDLTIVGCDSFGDTWNGAIFQVTLSKDTTLTACPIQNGCDIYTSTIEDAAKVPGCSSNPEYEVAYINIGTCDETPIIISGCTNPLALNYSECAIVDDGSCQIETENSQCINAQPISVALPAECSLNQIEVDLTSNTLEKTPSCTNNARADAYFEFIVPNSGSIKYASENYFSHGISLYKNCSESSVYCNDFIYQEIINELTPGDTLILQVFNHIEIEDYSFCIEEVQPSLNNNCLDAQFIEVAENGNCATNTTNFYNLNYNTTDVEPECASGILYDAFYQFIVPTNGQVLFSCNESVGISLYEACSEAAIFCDDNTRFALIANLPVGDTLTLQIYENNFQADFSFCVEEAIPTENNNCSNPKFIEVFGVDEYFTATDDTLLLKYNSLNIEPNCDFVKQDAFYQFVVPQNGKVLFSTNQYVGVSLYKSWNETSIYCNPPGQNYLEIENLTPLDTLILQLFEVSSDEDILFSLYEITPTFNDNCADAPLITVAPNGECDLNLINLNLNYNTLQREPDCETNVAADAYYQFVVPNSGSIRYYTPDGNAHGFSLYNSCNDSLIVCESYVYEEVIRGLTPGETLTLQIFNRYEWSNYSFCIEEVIPSANNDCLNAQPITVAETGTCESNIIESLNFHYNNANIQPECDEEILFDVFYEFVVPPSGNILFASDRTIGISIYNSCDNSSLFCNSYTDYAVIGDLPVGETLILQIFEDSDYRFDLIFCVEEVVRAANNDCSNAEFISVAEIGNCETNQIDVSNLSYNTPNIQPDCDEILYDVYYKFVVPPSGNILFASSHYVGISIFNSCSDYSIFCDDYLNFDIIRNLPEGDTLILQIFEDNFQSDFSFCLEDAPSSINDSCADALPITVAQSGNCQMHQVNLSYINNNSADIQTDCSYGYALPDVFYEFMVPPSGNMFFSTNQNVGFSILNSCTGESLWCYQGYSDNIIKDLPAGEMLILQVFSYNYQAEISFCLEEVVPSTNNNCVNALPITVAQTDDCEMHQVKLSNFNYNTVNFQPNCKSDIRYDAFYELTIPPSGQIRIDAEYNPGVAIYSSCNGTTLFCDEYIQNSIIRDLPAGSNVILQIFEDFNQSEINFCVEEVAPSLNNNCVDATSITVAESGNCEMHQVKFSNLNYNSPNIEPACVGYIYYDAFYEFVVPETGQVSFSCDDNVGIAIYEACNGNSLFCEDYTDEETIRNLPAGETVIFQIFEDGNQANFTFCLEESVPALNNLCINAEPFIVNEPGNCEGNYIQVLNTSNNSDINPYCADFVMADAFYSFIVPASGHIAISTSKTVGISIYDDCLEQSFYCSSSFNDQVIYGLIPGDTLVLQAFQTNNPDNFELCIEDAPPSNNNHCENAENLQVYEEGSCEGNLITALNHNNSVSINPSCEYITADIFYKLTIPENGQFRIVKGDGGSFGLSIYTTCYTTAFYCEEYIDGYDLIQGLPPNEEVILQFFQDDDPSDFELCIEEAIPSPNNDCSNAISVDVVSASDAFERTNTLNIRNNTVEIDPTCYSIISDAFYKFVVPQNGKIAINLSDDFGISLYKNCDGESIFCESYVSYIEIISDLPAGEEVILKIFSRYEYQNEVTFSIAEVMDNNSCENAAEICEPTISGSNLLPNPETSIDRFICTDFYEYVYNIAWYSFNANEAGDQVSFEITKGSCNQFSYMYASVLSGFCDDEPIFEDCILLVDDGEKATLTLTNPVANKQYYLVVASDYFYEYCNFEINVVEGIEYDCCEFDYSLDAWCNDQNPGYYFVDVTVNNFGNNPTGYSVVGTNTRLTSVNNTLTIGPIPNGNNTFTLIGVDQQNCIVTETIDFNCTYCEEHILHNNAQIKRDDNFSASKTIESNIQLTPATSLKYAAGDSITLKQGFTIEKGAEFSIDIQDCE